MDTQSKGAFKFVLKNDRKIINIPGTKVVSIKDQIVLSSGVLSLDYILGGGLQVGSILLIEEDVFGVFSKYLVKYFLAEGLASKHCLFVGSLDSNTRQLVRELPSPVCYSEDHVASKDSKNDEDDLKIAWRYQNSPVVQSAPTTSVGNVFGHNFDLTSPYPKDIVDHAEISFWPNIWPAGDCYNPYKTFLEDLQQRIQKQGHSIHSSHPRKTVLRVAIHRLGSPLWPDVDKNLPYFLLCLRKIIQNAYASAVITLPSSLLEEQGYRFVDPEILDQTLLDWMFHENHEYCSFLLWNMSLATVDQCEHMSDNVIKLVSLLNNPNPVYSEYNGLLTVLKLASLNTLATHVPDTHDWAFKLRKKRFVIEKLHLPPELQESTQREQDESGLPCASTKAASLDF